MGILWGILVRDPGGVGIPLGGISEGPHGGGARSAATGEEEGAHGPGGSKPQAKGGGLGRAAAS